MFCNLASIFSISARREMTILSTLCNNRRLVMLFLLCLVAPLPPASAFVPSMAAADVPPQLMLASSSHGPAVLSMSSNDKKSTNENVDQINTSVQIDEENPSSSSTQSQSSSSTTLNNNNKRKTSRWDALNPRVKARIVEAAQERAIANKQKNESPQAKKRRMMMYMKTRQQEKKLESRVRRPLPLNNRTPLATIIPGMEVTGIVISLTDFGAYVDIGTECDGLLHVSQLSDAEFIQHPRQLLTPGEEITVRVRSSNPEMKKLHLTMLSAEALEAEKRRKDEAGDRIQLDELAVDDELWGELRRVTNYGAYVEVGAVVDGFLHFMDHPAFGWSNGQHPSKYMNKGDRVRVWVSDIDFVQRRIKLTANRPKHLPGPRREI